MRLTGNINNIRNTRDSRNQDIALSIDKVEYITHKKDGKYFQPFDYLDELDTPLVITGDCLARSAAKPQAEGEYTFDVFDKTGEEYELNPNKKLSLTMEYDFDADLHILTAVAYIVTVPNEEFNRIKSEGAKRNKQKKSKRKR